LPDGGHARRGGFFFSYLARLRGEVAR
jgi:hypothetical protein